MAALARGGGMFSVSEVPPVGASSATSGAGRSEALPLPLKAPFPEAGPSRTRSSQPCNVPDTPS